MSSFSAFRERLRSGGLIATGRRDEAPREPCLGPARHDEHTGMVGDPSAINQVRYLLLQAPPPAAGASTTVPGGRSE